MQIQCAQYATPLLAWDNIAASTLIAIHDHLNLLANPAMSSQVFSSAG